MHLQQTKNIIFISTESAACENLSLSLLAQLYTVLSLISGITSLQTSILMMINSIPSVLIALVHPSISLSITTIFDSNTLILTTVINLLTVVLILNEL